MNRSLRIAVADDEADIRNYFRKMLPRLGHQVVAIAANGRELIEQCRATQPDLVITDVRMPEIDGVAATAVLWQERPVPILLLSAHFGPEHTAGEEATHVTGYLNKPIKQAELREAIARAMQRFDERPPSRQTSA
jgi:response regulator NasT